MLPTNIELLTIQAEGSFDGAGRLRDQYGITIAWSDEHQSLWIGAAVPEPLILSSITYAQRSARRDDDMSIATKSPHDRRWFVRNSHRLLRRASTAFANARS